MGKNRRWKAFALLAMGTMIVAACRVRDEGPVRRATRPVSAPHSGGAETIEVTRIVTETEMVAVTPLPSGVQHGGHLTVCMAREPQTLYWFGEAAPERAHVFHAIYDFLYLQRSYDYQAHGLARLPSVDNGDATVQEVRVAEGDTVSDAGGNVVTLAPGVWLKDARGERIRYNGGDVTLAQMVVDFELNPMVWEDGVPVTASDSVFAFELASDLEMAQTRSALGYTESYEATGAMTMRWTGIPGWLDSTYFLNAWQPLPRHAWGDLSAAELLEAERSNRRPLSYGPFRLTEWVPGERISLRPNENYWRAGYPRLESLTYLFVGDSDQLLAQLLAGRCDVGTHEGFTARQLPLLLEAERQGLLAPHFQTGTVYEHIAFGINPVESYAETRPDWFEDARVRQAVTLCTDRQRMVDEIFYGQSEVLHSYVPRIHPLFPQERLARWPYDPQAGNALLDEVGFVDEDGDGIREYYAGPHLAGADAQWDGTPFVVTLGASMVNGLRRRITQIFRENMARCGIEIVLSFAAPGELFAGGPQGAIFGRRFDLSQFAWLADVEPGCELSAGWNIPGPPGVPGPNGRPRYPQGWDGHNVTGWADGAFDRACDAARNALPGSERYVENHREAQRIFSRALPIMPLFLRLKVAAARPALRNFSVDPTQESELHNLYELELVPSPVP